MAYDFKKMLEKSKIKVTSLGLAAVMAVTMAGCTLSRDNDKNPVNNETITTTTMEVEAPNITEDAIEEVETTEEVKETAPSVVKEVVQDITYDELLEKFDASIEKFDAPTKDYLKQVFEIAYSNADDLLNTLSPLGLPNKNAFFLQKIVKPLQKIDFFKVITEENDDYSDLYQKYTTSRYVKEENGIYMFVAGWNENEQVQVALEEIIHAGQDYLIDANIDYATFEILTEGEANLYAWALAFGNINNDSLDFFYFKNSKKDLFQLYGSGYHDHSIASKYFIYLMSLVGYDAIDDLKYNNVDLSDIETKLSTTYNINGPKLLSDMADVMVDAACKINDARTDMMLNIEKTYNECLTKKVSKLDSKKDVMDYIRLYRFMNIQLGTRHLVKHDDGVYEDVTNKDEYLNRTHIEDLLFEKATEFGILKDYVVGLPEDVNIQRTIFDKGFVNSPRPDDYGDNFYSIDIFTSKITYKGNSLNVENMNGSSCVIPLEGNKKVVGSTYDINIPTYDSGYNK